MNDTKPPPDAFRVGKSCSYVSDQDLTEKNEVAEILDGNSEYVHPIDHRCRGP